MAFDRDQVATLHGTGFVVAAQPDFALAFTAKHVFTEGVLRGQRPVPGHAATALFIHSDHKKPLLEPNRLKIVWMGSRNAAMLSAAHATYCDTLDLAACILTAQPGESIAERVSIPLDTGVPSIGAVVHMVSMEGMDQQPTEIAPPSDHDGKGHTLSIFRRVSIRVGVVTGVYPQGYRQYGWPCFTTSIPARAGMSGGFVYWPRENTTIAACGIVCADNSTPESHDNLDHCGESVIGCAWPALALRLPLVLPSPPGAPTDTLLNMIRQGRIPLPLGGIEQIELVELGNGDCAIGRVN